MRYLLAALLAVSPALAATRYVDTNPGANCTGTTYNVSNRTCSGSDGPSYTTIQACVSAMAGGDTCFVRQGTYNENVTIPTLNGTAASPTRLLGYQNETVTINGTSGQTNIVDVASGGAHNFRSSSNLATITCKAASGSVGCNNVEIGKFVITPGNAGGIAVPVANGYYIHDITMTNLAPYTVGNAEPQGLIELHNSSNGFIERVTISNGGTRVDANVTCDHQSSDVEVRMLDVADLNGGIMQGHFSNGVRVDFVKFRNFQVWPDDDGAIRDMYNTWAATNRYWSAREGVSGAPIWGWFNSRRTDSTSGKASTVYWTSLSFQENATSDSNSYGAFHSASVNNGVSVADWRLYNSAPMDFGRGILLTNDGTTGTPCNYHENDFNASVNLSLGALRTDQSTCASAWSVGSGSLSLSTAAAKINTDHTLQSDSPLRDAGDNRTYGDSLYFPPPVGGGSRIDIGAYEFGAGAWPYEFQSQKTITAKNPATQTIRVCWSTSATSCDFTFPLWDHSLIQGSLSNRSTAVDNYWVEVDTSNTFKSGRSGVAAGFGALYASGATASTNQHHDIPAGTLTNGQAYYVRVRVGEQTAYDSNRAGPGPWSIGFYRFTVNSGGGGGPVCGNDTLESGETCDGTALNSQTCITQGFASGDLACAGDCQSYNTAGCVPFASNPSFGPGRGVTIKGGVHK